jgi:hypothetical protein
LIIDAVEQLADRDGIKSMKFSTADGMPFEDPAWIAGVDDNDNENSDDDSDDEEMPPLARRNDSFSDTDSDDDSDSDDEDSHDEDPFFDDDDVFDMPDQVANDDPPEIETEDDPVADLIDPNPTEIETDKANVEVKSEAPELRRSTRESRPPERYGFEHLQHCHNTVTIDDAIEYDPMIAGVAARFIDEVNEVALMNGHQFGQQYIVQKGLKKFGKRGKDATLKELRQLHDRVCFEPVGVSSLSANEKKKAQEALLFLNEKRDGSVKGRMVYNGKPTREWLSKEDNASPTVSLESLFLTAIVDAKEGRDVMSCDIPNAFIQADMPEIENGADMVVMKIKGILLQILMEISPETYGPYVVMEDGKLVIYLRVLKALYGMLVAALLWYRKFRNDLEEIGFVFNPYDPCVANRTIKGSQQTVRFHVDDLKSSHISSRVNDLFLVWLNKMYGKHGAVTSTRGKSHEYLGMRFDYSVPGQVTVDMVDYMTKITEEFPFDVSKPVPTPAADNIFQVDESSPVLDQERAEIFHTFVAKALFACKRSRCDLQVAVAMLCTRVQKPTEEDWKKLLRMMRYIRATIKDVLNLRADDLSIVKWYVDASFAVHPDFKSHTGAAMTYGAGVPIAMSRKQKLNTRSSTEAELVGVDDGINLILWTKLFLEAQDLTITTNTVFQDNQSAILLEVNGKRSSSNRTRALNIRYFFITDQVEAGNISVEFCPTKAMIADFFTKPLQGELFLKFKRFIMGTD